jgi:hypothetical protein
MPLAAQLPDQGSQVEECFVVGRSGAERAEPSAHCLRFPGQLGQAGDRAAECVSVDMHRCVADGLPVHCEEREGRLLGVLGVGRWAAVAATWPPNGVRRRMYRRPLSSVDRSPNDSIVTVAPPVGPAVTRLVQGPASGERPGKVHRTAVGKTSVCSRRFGSQRSVLDGSSRLGTPCGGI